MLNGMALLRLPDILALSRLAGARGRAAALTLHG